MTEQSISTWFKTQSLGDYYQQTFNQNMTNSIKFTPRLLRAFFGPIAPSGSAYQAGIARLIDSVGNLAISSICSLPEAKVLRYVPFEYLEDDTKNYLRKGVCEFIQSTSMNSTFFEKTLQNSLSTPSFSLSEDLTNWFLTSDPSGIYLKQIIANSGIKDYEVVSGNYLITHNAIGNYLVIKEFDIEAIKKFNPDIKN